VLKAKIYGSISLFVRLSSSWVTVEEVHKP
jgi:hypothetical protein